jgi:hypothetical protein
MRMAAGNQSNTAAERRVRPAPIDHRGDDHPAREICSILLLSSSGAGSQSQDPAPTQWCSPG